jgi:hypothetical protein
MKITRQRIKRIIKEQTRQPRTENQGAMDELYNAIDSLIALGITHKEIMNNAELYLDDAHGGYHEHPGQDMLETDKPAEMDEGTELGDMPDSWRQILGDHIKG